MAANKPNHPWGPDARKGPISAKRRNRESISIHTDRTEAISGASEKLRHTWNIHRSVNHRWGGYCGGYIGGSIPDEETAALPLREQGEGE